MNLLVIGASGLVGSHVFAGAMNAGWSVHGTCRQPSMVPELIDLDATDLPAFTGLLKRTKPAVVVNAAGFTWVDGCEADPARARRENLEAPLAQVEACRSAGVGYVYFSTSYVFDGASGPYDESATPNPVNTYGQSKLDAERALISAHPGGVLVPRLIWVYGREPRMKNFAYQLLRAMNDGASLRVPDDQLGNATWAGDIASETLRLIEARTTGIVHLASDNLPAGRMDWANAMVREFLAAGANCEPGFQLCPVSSAALDQPARRPRDARLVSIRRAKPHLNSTPLPDVAREIVRHFIDPGGNTV